ncbi:MAG: chordopoxvirus fusion protein, partial [Chloroflexaceae bacterium]|nr:chordopoxvirus fusion protein [Chloroflexaceae bacterium]
QQRTERRVEALEDTVQKLAEAQQRTERRLEELAEAQLRTESEVARLAKELRATRQEVGGLAMTIGYTLENEAYRALPALLERDHGILVQEHLVRRYVTDKYGESIEINIIGKALLQEREVTVIGEGKAQLSQKGVDQFIRRKLNRLEGVVGEIFPVLVTHMVSSPQVETYAQEQGIALYHSFQFGQLR